MMSWGIQLRWVSGGRIPAANMYESMLFLAWGVGFFAVAAYAVLRNRLVVINAAGMAALTMMLTDLLPIDPFIHPVAPVLAGTPWLAIHVPIIMVSYSILALGLVVAHMQIGFTIFAPDRTELIDRMYDLLYWYIFVGSLFLIAGIITGSMWAASSWGRYWGWDPKEVWSLVAFLAYMAILHAKLDQADRQVRGGGHQHRRLPDHPDDLPGGELRADHRHALLRHGRFPGAPVDAAGGRWPKWRSWPGARWPTTARPRAGPPDAIEPRSAPPG